MTRLKELRTLGQSIWYDNIQRALLEQGELHRLVEMGITGVTSNPSIFHKAIHESAAYDAAIADEASRGRTPLEIYEALALEDIREAADVLRPVFDRSHGHDGYVSLEVNPSLASDSDGTIDEAMRLFRSVGRPNAMIKVPATPAGVTALSVLISQGVHVNATLLFSLSHYNAVAEAYLQGLEKRVASDQPVGCVASVASFFVSRVDTAVDRVLASQGETRLQGVAAIANAKAAYARFQEIFSGPRWAELAAAGARVQRPLWASTGTKDPRYADTLYVDALIGPHTVNTVPPATLEAFLDHGTVTGTLLHGAHDAQAQLAQLQSVGVDLEAVTETLQAEGLRSFAEAFDALLQVIEGKAGR